ncbi:MAG: nitronate monooxygenase [Pseudonocardiaceae bacterium]|nr:nitronate monooxygenase [Pseudonocardiaceae bacterium]
MPIRTPATELLGIEIPIVLAPMDGVSGGELAVAVSRAGGLGMVGGGYGDAEWLTRQLDAVAGARVGCGFITWSLAQQPALLDLALERGPVAVMLSFGNPAPFAASIKACGASLLCQVQNREQAEHALDSGADVLVAQGSEAGGHGFGPRTTLTLVPEIADLLVRRGSDAVVLAAGGIADGRGLAAALTLGASGALVGSRFYAAAEALTTPQARERVVAATGADARRTTVYDVVRRRYWPAGHTISVLGNDFVSRWHGAEAELQQNLEAAAVDYWQGVRDRDYDIANVTVGQGAGLIGAVLPAADIVMGIASRADAILTRLANP